MSPVGAVEDVATRKKRQVFGGGAIIVAGSTGVAIGDCVRSSDTSQFAVPRFLVIVNSGARSSTEAESMLNPVGGSGKVTSMKLGKAPFVGDSVNVGAVPVNVGAANDQLPAIGASVTVPVAAKSPLIQ